MDSSNKQPLPQVITKSIGKRACSPPADRSGKKPRIYGKYVAYSQKRKLSGSFKNSTRKIRKPNDSDSDDDNNNNNNDNDNDIAYLMDTLASTHIENDWSPQNLAANREKMAVVHQLYVARMEALRDNRKAATF
jgi:hypothetical protein